MKHEQGNDIYLVVSIGNLDELVDLDDEVPRTFDTEKGALDDEYPEDNCSMPFSGSMERKE